MNRVCKGSIAMILATALGAAPLPVLAQSASSLRDLVGARASSGEDELEARGFTHITSHSGGRAVFAYWWNGAHKDCVMVTTRDGRYSSITNATPSDCNQKRGGPSTGAVVGAVAGAALLAVILSHKSGNHDDGQHYEDPQREREYERGYNDGLYRANFNGRGNSDYAEGYRNGTRQRQNNVTNNRSYGNAYGRNYGYDDGAKVNFGDLQGARAAGALSDLESRGFRRVDAFQSGNDSGTVWWSGASRQCVQVITVDGRINSINDIGTHPRCR